LGSAEEIEPKDKPYFVELLISKHPDIAGFINGSDNALFKVRISDFIIASFSSIETVHVNFEDH
jgi:hypothetical protein